MLKQQFYQQLFAFDVDGLPMLLFIYLHLNNKHAVTFMLEFLVDNQLLCVYDN